MLPITAGSSPAHCGVSSGDGNHLFKFFSCALRLALSLLRQAFGKRTAESLSFVAHFRACCWPLLFVRLWALCSVHLMAENAGRERWPRTLAENALGCLAAIAGQRWLALVAFRLWLLQAATSVQTIYVPFLVRCLLDWLQSEVLRFRQQSLEPF